MNRSTALADLVWSINSPSLVDSSEFDFAIDPSDVDCDHLLQHLDAKPVRRVGRYFETLVLYFLQQVQKYEIVAFGRPIVDDGRTVGEIDFLFRDHTGLLTHLEVAVKFYLHLNGNPFSGSHFVGPNASDTFERKTDKLFNHQLPLSQIYHPEVDRRIGLMKGRIYYPQDCQAPTDSPERLSIDHLRGIWSYASNVAELETDQSESFLVLSKPNWLATDSNSKTLNRDQFQETVQDHFDRNTSPMHVSIVRDGAEIDRVFVVADTWPGNSSV